MGIIYVNYGTDFTILAQGGYKNMLKYFIAALDELYALANYMGGTLVLAYLNEEAWNLYLKDESSLIDKNAVLQEEVIS